MQSISPCRIFAPEIAHTQPSYLLLTVVDIFIASRECFLLALGDDNFRFANKQRKPNYPEILHNDTRRWILAADTMIVEFALVFVLGVVREYC
jgi:hypothetical protein